MVALVGALIAALAFYVVLSGSRSASLATDPPATDGELALADGSDPDGDDDPDSPLLDTPDGAFDEQPSDRPTIVYVVGDLDEGVFQARPGQGILGLLAGANQVELQVAGALADFSDLIISNDEDLEAIHLADADLVVISASTSSQAFQRFMLKATVPVIAMKPANWVALGLAEPAEGPTTPLQDLASIDVDRSHPIAQYVTEGTGEIDLFVGNRFSVGRSWTPDEAPTGDRAADVVANGPDGAALIAFDAGDNLGFPYVDPTDRAIACRVAFPSHSSTNATLSQDGMALLIGAAEWSLAEQCRAAENPIRPSVNSLMCQTEAADEDRFASNGQLLERTDADPVNLSSLWVRAVQYAEVDQDPIVFLGGRFQQAFDAPVNSGADEPTQSVARAGVFGCNLNDGTVTDFEVPIEVDSLTPVGNTVENERVRALAYDGTWLYVGGKFRISPSAIGTQIPAELADANFQLIRVDPLTGEIDSSWIPRLQGSVSALEIAGDWIYAGGGIRSADGAPANRLIRLNIGAGADGSADTEFRPVVEATIGVDGGDPFASVLAFELAGDTLVIGGSFQMVDGQPRNSLASFNLTTGELLDFNPSIGDNNVGTDPIPQIKDIALMNDGAILACGDWWVISPTPGLTWTAYDHDAGVANPNQGEWYGQFSKIQPRPNQFNHGKFDLATGAAQMVDGRPWGPVTDGGIQACDVDNRTNMVILGGHYESVGDYQPGFAPANDNDYPDSHVAFEKLTAVDGTTGEIIPWDPDIDSIRGLDAVAVIPGVTPSDSEIIVGGALTTADRVEQNGAARYQIHRQ